MDEDDIEDYDREVELALYREYRDVVGQFRYVVETERRFYLANDVTVERRDTEHDFYFELTMNDVWVWDVYLRRHRAGRARDRRHVGHHFVLRALGQPPRGRRRAAAELRG